MEDKKSETDIQELQNLLYGLFQSHILTINGKVMQEGDRPPETYIAKSEVVEKMIQLLNEFGKALAGEDD